MQATDAPKGLHLSMILNQDSFWINLQKVTTSVQFSRSVVSDSATPWTAAHQASLSITNSQS